MNAPSRHISTRLEPWAVSEPKYGFVTSEWMVSLSDGSHRRFKSRFDALCFVNESGAPSLKEQLAASLAEIQERTEYRFEEADADRQFGREEGDSWHWNRETEESEID